MASLVKKGMTPALPQKEQLLPTSFFQRPAEVVARELLGTYLRRETPEGICGGRVVETEAYLGQDDPASHSAVGRTRRNAVMFGPAGRAYVYFIYGMHFCFNVTTASEEVAAAVLLRALEPVEGLELMARRRGRAGIRELTSGPARLAQALAIDLSLNGRPLDAGALAFWGPAQVGEPVRTSPRVGVSRAADWPLRFYLEGNPFVSRAGKVGRP